MKVAFILPGIGKKHIQLHGPGTCDSASHYESSDHQERAHDRDGAIAAREQEGEDYFPHRSNCHRGDAAAFGRASGRLPHAG